MLFPEGSDVRIVASERVMSMLHSEFRVDSGESVLSIHHGPMVTYECCHESSNDTITCLPEALANVGQDDDQHTDVP